MFETVFIGVVLGILCIGSVFSDGNDFDLLAEESQLYDQGSGKSFDSAQQAVQGEAGRKGYNFHQRADKGQTGNFNKEREQKEYAEEGGNNKAAQQDDGFYVNAQKSGRGEKGYNYVDQGSYAKGHDTKGHHNVRKLDEFKKEKEFFDKDQDANLKENYGAYALGATFKNGGFLGGGFDNQVYYDGGYGSKGKNEKGAFNAEESGNKKAAGREQTFQTAQQLAKSFNGEILKKLGFSNLKGFF